jgi:hypothetical protein
MPGFHQVFFISDIATADGLEIDDAYRGKTPNPDRESQWKWPSQGQPGAEAWRVWNRALQHLEIQGKLRVPQGAWTATAHQRWRWRIALQSEDIHHSTEAGPTMVYHPILRTRQRRGNYYDSTTAEESLDIPNEPMAAVTLHDESNGWESIPNSTVDRSNATRGKSSSGKCRGKPSDN